MYKNNNWLMLAVVCGIIAYAYMQRKKPALVFPLPSFKESFGDVKSDPEAQLAILHARIFGLKNPRYSKAIGELVRSQIPASQLKLAGANARKYNAGLINELKRRGVKYTPPVRKAKKKAQVMGKAPIAKQVVVANGQAIAQPAFVMGKPTDKLSEIEKRCKANLLSQMISANAPKLTTNQRNDLMKKCLSSYGVTN